MDELYFNEVEEEITITEFFSEKDKLIIYKNSFDEITFECANKGTVSLSLDKVDLLIKYLEVIKNGNQ